MERWWCARSVREVDAGRTDAVSRACDRMEFHKLESVQARGDARKALRRSIGGQGKEAVARDKADIDAMHRAWCKEGGESGGLNVEHAACRAFMHSRNIADHREL